MSSVSLLTLEPLIPGGQSGEDASSQATASTGDHRSGDTVSRVGGAVMEGSTDTFSDIWDVYLTRDTDKPDQPSDGAKYKKTMKQGVSHWGAWWG